MTTKYIPAGAGLILLMAMTTQAVEPARIRMDTVLRDVVSSVKVKQDSPDKRRFEGKRRFDVVVLENRYLQVLVCPELGERILNIVDKTTGRKCFFEGTISYSGSAYTEGGGSGGGMQINHPLYHAGTSYVVPLPYTTEITDDGTAVLTLAYTSYPHLQHTVWQIRLRADEAAIRSAYRFENFAPFSMGFNPWIDASFPMKDDAQFTLPSDWIAGHWLGINPIWKDGDAGHFIRPWPVGANGKDQSYLKNRKWSAAFAYGMTGGYAGIYYHDTHAGFAHVFDPETMPGAKAAGAWSTNGWLEVWGAFTHNMEDPRWLGPHETVSAEDMWFPFHGIGGMTWANENGALNLKKDGDQITCGVYMLRDRGTGAVHVTADGNVLLQAPLNLRPEEPFFRKLDCPPETDEVRMRVMDASGRVLMDRQVFFSARDTREIILPESPWHRKTQVTEARWQEAFTPLMAWGPWYHPPTTYAKALTADSNDVEAMIGRARSLIKEASANLFRGRPQGVTAESQYLEAIAILTKLTESHPAEARVIHLLGLAQIKTAKPEEAARTLSRLVGTPDDSALVRYQLGLLAAAEGRWPDAIAQSQSALALAPDSALSRLLLAIGLLKTGKPGDVHTVLAPMLAVNPADIHAVMLLRRAAEAAGQSQEAVRLAAELSRLDKLAPVQYTAATVALSALEQGRDLDPYAVDTTVGPAELPGREP